jgi:O-antigen/teichoic acid export membrane protein
MTTKRTIARNVICNGSGMAVSLAVGMVTVRLLVDRLGEDSYGLWILIASLTGYFGLLDLGIRGSVGRNMAYCRARGDRAGVDAMFGTALAILTVPATLVLLATVFGSFLFCEFFRVPAQLVPDARFALLLVGLNLALSILLSVFDAALWSIQRFDILNAIDVPAGFVRLGLTLVLVHNSHDLPTLAIITLASTLFTGLAKMEMAWRQDSLLDLRLASVTREAARALLNLGGWSWVGSVSRIINAQCSVSLIGRWLGTTALVPFSVVMRLIGAASGLIIAASGVLQPVATVLYATENEKHQQKLVIDGGKFSLALSLFFFSLFLLLGGSLLDLWLGRTMEQALPLLVILALGESLPLSQQVSVAAILGMGKHRALALAGLVENACMVVLALSLMPLHGVLGMGLALAVPAFLCRGVFPLLFICRELELPLSTYLARAMIPALLAAVLPAGGLALLVQQGPPTSWFDLVAYGGCFTAAYLCSCFAFFFPRRIISVTRQFLLRSPLNFKANLDSTTASLAGSRPAMISNRSNSEPTP